MINLLKQLSRSLTIFLFFMLSGCFMLHAQKAGINTSVGNISTCKTLQLIPNLYHSCMSVDNLNISFPATTNVADVESITFHLSFSHKSEFFSLKNTQFDISCTHPTVHSWYTNVTLLKDNLAKIKLIPNNRKTKQITKAKSDLITAIMGITRMAYDGQLCDGNDFETIDIHIKEININLRTAKNPNIADEVLKRSLIDYCIGKGSKTQEDAYTLSKSFQIAPNPAKEHCLLTVAPGEKVQHIALYNVAGQSVLESNSIDSQRFQLDVKHLERGVYLLKIQTLTAVETRKLLLQ